jgi:hypothetical protein
MIAELRHGYQRERPVGSPLRPGHDPLIWHESGGALITDREPGASHCWERTLRSYSRPEIEDRARPVGYRQLVADDLEQAVSGRPGWTLSGRVATFDAGNGWTGRVTEVVSPAKWTERFHAAAIDPGGLARHTTFLPLPRQAVEWVQRVTTAQ